MWVTIVNTDAVKEVTNVFIICVTRQPALVARVPLTPLLCFPLQHFACLQGPALRVGDVPHAAVHDRGAERRLLAALPAAALAALRGLRSKGRNYKEIRSFITFDTNF